MKRSHFFYKELTLAEVGRKGTHEVYVRLPNNFDYDTFFNHSAVQNGTVMEVNFEANDITDSSNKEIVSLRFVYFNNSNKEKRIPSLAPLFKNHNVEDGDVVCLESRNIDGDISYYISFYKKGQIQIIPNSIFISNIEFENKPQTIPSSSEDEPLQQIFYGAPGTGKSNTIKEKVEEAKKRHHRTTFHPDSDYSTFVGAYKPTMKNSIKKQTILDYEALVDKLKEYIIFQQQNITKACTLFGFDFHDSIVQMQTTPEHTIAQLVADGYKSGTTYDSQVRAGMSAYENSGIASNQEDQIVYTFVPQAFTKAYVEAWSTTEEVYLIIEEINRGNCAQIFGDIFQLLDRKNGISEYPIEADDDLRDHIGKELAKSGRTDIPEDVKSGKKLKLPSNLYIWATMNTSDQSLFPIDSAFKRRWEWKYFPIAEGIDKKTGEKLNWKIAVDDGHKYDWWKFVQQMNRVVGKATSSEDKKMGYFFCIADNKGEIGVETFVSKVIFYLWNDVFKDNGLDWILDEKAVFKYKAKDDNGIEHDEEMTFPTFFLPDGKANPRQVENLMENLNIENEFKKEEKAE